MHHLGGCFGPLWGHKPEWEVQLCYQSIANTLNSVPGSIELIPINLNNLGTLLTGYFPKFLSGFKDHINHDATLAPTKTLRVG